MATQDAIEIALAADIDWGQFEQLVVEILRSHDLPQIQKLGGSGDKGLDAVQEGFFQNQRQLDVGVQITSQKTQRIKVKDTLDKFQKYKIAVKRVVFVFKEPCSSKTRAAIQEDGANYGIEIDVRDQSYLIAELGRTGSTIFARYFGESLREQFEQLLSQDDPLGFLDEKTKHAMLASLGAYLLSKPGRLAQGKLLELTVLAVLTVQTHEISIENLQREVQKQFVEKDLQRGQIVASLDRLRNEGYCSAKDGFYSPTSRALAEVGAVTSRAADGFANLVDVITDKVRTQHRINDAQAGYLERNLKRTIGLLVRNLDLAQSESGTSVSHDSNVERSLLAIVGKDLDGKIARTALIALQNYISEPETRERIVPLMRSYAILVMRNLDPLGKRWESNAVRRSILLLDTDAVLCALISELPESVAYRKALAAFEKDHVEIVITNNVLQEVALHLDIAYVTYNKFRDVLAKLPEVSVEPMVWNALVRGYWYALETNPKMAWEDYKEGYLDRSNVVDYLSFLLKKIMPTVKFINDIEPVTADRKAFDEISKWMLESRERNKVKAQFRHEEERRERTENDVKMLLYAARRAEDQSGGGFGYLVTQDGSFWLAEQHEIWLPRQHVAVRTRLLPQLSEFCCGVHLDDDLFIRLIFEPITVSVGELMRNDIATLASIGVDLRHTKVERLEWSLQGELGKRIHEFEGAMGEDEESMKRAAIHTLKASSEAGLTLDPALQEVIRGYEAMKSDSEELRKLKENLGNLLYEVAGDSGKGRTRANKVIQKLGLKDEAKK